MKKRESIWPLLVRPDWISFTENRPGFSEASVWLVFYPDQTHKIFKTKKEADEARFHRCAIVELKGEFSTSHIRGWE